MTNDTAIDTDLIFQSVVDCLYGLRRTARRADLPPAVQLALADATTAVHLAFAERLDTRWYGN